MRADAPVVVELRFPRWPTAAGAGFALVLAPLAASIHLPPVRARVLAAALGALAPCGVEGRAESLDYNLLTLRARVAGLSLAADGRGDAPFFEADEVEIDLPWSAAWRGLAIDSLTIVKPRLRVARQSDSSLNLPSPPRGEVPVAEETQPGEATAIAIGRVEVRNLGASFADRTAELDADVSGVELLLAPAQDGQTAGALRLEGSGRLRSGDHETRLHAVESRLAFDGTRVSLEATRLALDEGELRLSGSIGVLEAAPDGHP